MSPVTYELSSRGGGSRGNRGCQRGARGEGRGTSAGTTEALPKTGLQRRATLGNVSLAPYSRPVPESNLFVKVADSSQCPHIRVHLYGYTYMCTHTHTCLSLLLMTIAQRRRRVVRVSVADAALFSVFACGRCSPSLVPLATCHLPPATCRPAPPQLPFPQPFPPFGSRV